MSERGFTTKSAPVGLDKLNGGLNSTASALGLQTSESTDLQNIDFDVFGSIKKRKGYTQLNTSAANSGATCTGLFNAGFKSGTKLFGAFEDGIFKMDDLDGTWDSITLSGTSITTGDNNLLSMTFFDDRLLATNNVDAPIQWLGGSGAVKAVVPTGLTKAKWTIDWNNYAFYFNVTVSGTAYPSRGYWSAIKDTTTWPATNFIDVELDNGEEITGVKPLGDRLVVFKENSIYYWLFTGDSDIPFVVIRSASDVGCISGYSIQEVNNGLVFLAYDGLYFFDGNDSIKLSDRVNATLDTFAKNRFQYAVSAYQRETGHYWLSFSTSGGTSHNRCLIWDSRNNAFSLYNGHNSNYFTVLLDSGTEKIYFGDYAGFVYQADNGTSDNPSGTATAIDAYWKSKWFNFGDLFTEKATTNIVLYYQLKQAILTFGYSYDLDNGTQYSQTIDTSTSSDVYDTAEYEMARYAKEGGRVERRNLAGRGRVLRIEFSNDVLDEEFQIDGAGFELTLETNQ